MLKFVACAVALSIAGMAVPLMADAKEGSDFGREAIREAKRNNENKGADDKGGLAGPVADDKGGATGPAADDKGGANEPGDDRDKLGLDRDVKNCYVYVPSDRMPEPYLRFKSAADRARLEAEATLLATATVIYADDITQFHDLNDDSAKTFSLKAEQFRIRHRLGARGCSS
ncbi:hypothetical protein SAE02_60290 [Skermanella aerolata]|uniref:Uncharacterized protein n=1 Tax=Skermanella aerolata TaxID=393310 RepID=A0A512DZI2_9PROT|nr:hypothetical protein [Skermanella aerolata]KJB90272.1 hypothetical protein N826_30200 [Skermanella aerolata KACC 11604]GEO41881.1 hypothetical protein SAE02_60290 [Skermanella aerolata]